MSIDQQLFEDMLYEYLGYYEKKDALGKRVDFSQASNVSNKMFDIFLLGSFPEIITSTTRIEILPGWIPLVSKLTEEVAEISRECGTKIQVFQIKEKFGGLRYYIDVLGDVKDSERNSTLERTQKIILEAEAASMKICEVCSEAGKQFSRNGWLSTTCEDHRLPYTGC